MARYFIILFATMAVVIGCAWVWVVKEPMSFLDNAYPIFRAKMDMATDLPAGSVVILGDSRPMVGLVPAQLGPDVYNLAVSGGSPIEVWAYARLALSGPHPPRAVILSLAPFRCITDAAFWDSSVKFGLLDGATVEEIRQRSRRYPGDLVLGRFDRDRLDPSIRQPLFGPETVGDIEARLKTNLYAIHFPSYYFSALELGGVYQREEGNRQIYRDVLASRGHRLLWTDNGTRALSPDTTASSFAPSPLLDSYLAETIELFQKRNIPVYFIGGPLSDVSTAALQPVFAREFDHYIRNYEKTNSNFHVLGPTLATLPWTDFGEAGHLNAAGAKIFSDNVAALLREADIEK